MVTEDGPLSGTDENPDVTIDETDITPTAVIDVEDGVMLSAIVGPQNAYLEALAEELDVEVGIRGGQMRARGKRSAVRVFERTIIEVLDLLEYGGKKVVLNEADMRRVAKLLRAYPERSLKALYDDNNVPRHTKRIVTPKSFAQREYVNAIRECDLVFGVGPAGTGKTYLATAMAVEALESKRVKRIVLTRPAVEAGERLGFLPGDLSEKVDPYLRPLYDALGELLSAKGSDRTRLQQLLESQVIEIAPLAYMRGRTLNDAFVILDEAQNTTPQQMKMFLTRIGFGSKTIVTGDITQTDLPSHVTSGLRDANQRLRSVEGTRFVHFSAHDVVRHPLVARIIRAYEASE